MITIDFEIIPLRYYWYKKKTSSRNTSPIKN